MRVKRKISHHEMIWRTAGYPYANTSREFEYINPLPADCRWQILRKTLDEINAMPPDTQVLSKDDSTKNKWEIAYMNRPDTGIIFFPKDDCEMDAKVNETNELEFPVHDQDDPVEVTSTDSATRKSPSGAATKTEKIQMVTHAEGSASESVLQSKKHAGIPCTKRHWEDLTLHEFMSWFDLDTTQQYTTRPKLLSQSKQLYQLRERKRMVTTPHLKPDKNYVAYCYAMLKLYSNWRTDDDICPKGENPIDVFSGELRALRDDEPSRLKVSVERVDFSTTFFGLLDKLKIFSRTVGMGVPDDPRTTFNPPRSDEDAVPPDDILDYLLDEEEDEGVVPKWTEKQFDKRVARLESQQRNAFDILERHACSDPATTDPLYLFVTGPGGTGKSDVLHCMAQSIGRTQEHAFHSFAIGSFTGTASYLIGGRTLHSLLVSWFIFYANGNASGNRATLSLLQDFFISSFINL